MHAFGEILVFSLCNFFHAVIITDPPTTATTVTDSTVSPPTAETELRPAAASFVTGILIGLGTGILGTIISVLIILIIVVTLKIHLGHHAILTKKQAHDSKNLGEGYYESLDSEVFYAEIVSAPPQHHQEQDDTNVHVVEATTQPYSGPSSTSEPSDSNPQSNQGSLSVTEDAITSSATDAIVTPTTASANENTLDHISDACVMLTTHNDAYGLDLEIEDGDAVLANENASDTCSAKGDISTACNDAYGLPLPQYDEEPEYTNIRLYEATMRLYTDPTDSTSTYPTATDPTSTDPTSTDPTSTDPTSTDPTSTSEPSSSHPQSSQGDLPATEDAITSSATEDAIVTCTPDHISDVCVEGVIPTTHNDAYGLPLPQYDEEPEYTNVRLYEATMRLYTDPISTDPTSTDPTSTDPTSTDPTSTDPTSTDPTSTDPTSTDPTSTDPTSTDPNATSEPPSTHPQSSQGDLPATEATSATGDTIITPVPDHIGDACAEGVISTTHNDAYGLPLPEYDKEPEYTNIRLYEATMRLYFDPTSTNASSSHPQSSEGNLLPTSEDVTTPRADLVDPDDNKMYGGGAVSSIDDQRDLTPKFINKSHSESASINAVLSSAAEQDGSHKLKQVRETWI